ncbi:MAG: hypothetical protein ACREGH_03755 [Minisyncoccia bacterium]
MTEADSGSGVGDEVNYASATLDRTLPWGLSFPVRLNTKGIAAESIAVDLPNGRVIVYAAPE